MNCPMCKADENWLHFVGAPFEQSSYWHCRRCDAKWRFIKE